MRAILLLGIAALAACDGDAVGVRFKADPTGPQECGIRIVEREVIRRGEPTLDTIPCHYLSPR